MTWDTVTWTADLPAFTGIQIQVQTSDDGSTWSGWGTVTNGGSVSSVHSRYLRYKLVLTTTAAGSTPVVRDISFTWR